MQRQPTNSEHELLPQHIEVVDWEMAKRYAAMTPERKMQLLCETIDSTRVMVEQSVRHQYPAASDDEVRQIVKRKYCLA